MRNIYINRIEKSIFKEEYWTCISNDIIDSIKLELVDKTVMTICLSNSNTYNVGIIELRCRTGMGKTKLINSKERLIENRYMKQVHSKMKIWEHYVDETGTSTFKKYVNRASGDTSGYTQVANSLLYAVGDDIISPEELGIMLLLLRNKNNFEQTYKGLEKKSGLSPNTFDKYFSYLKEKGYVDVHGELVFTDEAGNKNFPPRTRVQKRRQLIEQMKMPIRFKDSSEKEFVLEVANKPKEEWGELSPEVHDKVVVQHLKIKCPSLAS